MTGSNEREFVNAVEALGYRAMRGPASGSGTKRELPDVLYGRPTSLDSATSQVYVSELKHHSGERIYFDREQVNALVEFAEEFGADDVLVGKFKDKHIGVRSPFYLAYPPDLHQTENAYVMVFDVIEEQAFAKIYPETDNQSAEMISL